jgi:hypothetical protein
MTGRRTKPPPFRRAERRIRPPSTGRRPCANPNSPFVGGAATADSVKTIGPIRILPRRGHKHRGHPRSGREGITTAAHFGCRNGRIFDFGIASSHRPFARRTRSPRRRSGLAAADATGQPSASVGSWWPCPRGHSGRPGAARRRSSAAAGGRPGQGRVRGPVVRGLPRRSGHRTPARRRGRTLAARTAVAEPAGYGPIFRL